MTMPTLIQNHRRSVVETSLKKFYTNMNQAILRSVVDNGDTKYWTFAGDSISEHENFYNRYLKNYLKTLKTELAPYQSGSGINNRFTITFPDGSAVAVGYRAHDWYYCIKAKDLQHFAEKRGTGCFAFGFYPPGINATPDSYSSKNFKGKGFEPYVVNVAQDENGEQLKDDDGNLILTTEKDLYKQKSYAKAIQLNGWRIPDDYPLKF